MLRAWLLRGLFVRAWVVDHNADRIMHDFLDHADIVTVTAAMDQLPAAIAPDVVLLAIKPQQINDVLPHLAKYISPQTLVVTVVAGIHSDRYQSHLNNHPLVRLAPNTPAMLGKGMTAGFANAAVTDAQKQTTENLSKALGDFFWVGAEAQLDLAMGISGSGPAYYFYFTELLAAAAQKHGMGADDAMRLARQTLVGAAAMAEAEASTPLSELRANVTSKGGITEACLRVWNKDDTFQDIISAGIDANVHRSRELAGD